MCFGVGPYLEYMTRVRLEHVVECLKGTFNEGSLIRIVEVEHNLRACLDVVVETLVRQVCTADD